MMTNAQKELVELLQAADECKMRGDSDGQRTLLDVAQHIAQHPWIADQNAARKTAHQNDFADSELPATPFGDDTPMTLQDAVEFLQSIGVKAVVSTLKREASNRRLEVVRIGGKPYLTRNALRKWIAGATEPTRPEPTPPRKAALDVDARIKRALSLTTTARH